MNLDELQSIRDRERQSDSLQQLRESFYQDAGEFVRELREQREAAADRADDPFDSPEVNRLTDDINTAEQTVEAIYERRVGKLVKMASFAAADMPTEDEGLTAEERQLFEQLVDDIETNRERVFAVLDGEDVPPPDSSPAETDTPTRSGQTSDADGPSTLTDDPAGGHPDSKSETGVEAADLMGAGGEADAEPQPDSPTTSPARRDEGATDNPPDAESTTEPATPDRPATGADRPADSTTGGTPATGASSADTPETQTAANAGESEGVDRGHSTEAAAVAGDTHSDPADASGTAKRDGGEPVGTSVGDGVDRATVRITEDVGGIFGVDQREYDLAREDVVTLPADNAEALVESNAAERLD